ncbi:MAG: penicillin acylase family protein [Dehalococcoidia bacterium]|nr:penicillin acylase family protein [Dehalococcoidia bacterium]
MLEKLGLIPYSGNIERISSTQWYASKSNFNVGMLKYMSLIIDTGNFSKSIVINSTSIRGHAGSQWCHDPIIPQAKVKYPPILWSRSSIEVSPAHKLNLNP